MSTLRVLRIAQLLVGFDTYALNEAVRKQQQVANGEIVIPVGDDTTIIVDAAARIAGAEVVSDNDLYDLACVAAGTAVVRDDNELQTALQVVSTIDDDSFESVYQQAQNWLVGYRLAKQTESAAIEQPQPNQTILIAAPAAEENNMENVNNNLTSDAGAVAVENEQTNNPLVDSAINQLSDAIESTDDSRWGNSLREKYINDTANMLKIAIGVDAAKASLVKMLHPAAAAVAAKLSEPQPAEADKELFTKQLIEKAKLASDDIKESIVGFFNRNKKAAE